MDQANETKYKKRTSQQKKASQEEEDWLRTRKNVMNNLVAFVIEHIINSERHPKATQPAIKTNNNKPKYTTEEVQQNTNSHYRKLIPILPQYLKGYRGNCKDRS